MPSKTDSGTQTTQGIQTNQQGNFDLLLARWVGPPLAAQTIGGTYQQCFGVRARWSDPTLGFTDDSVVRYKVHIYLAQGQTTTRRATLLDNYLDPVNFPGTSGQVWRGLQTAQTLATAAAQDGDVPIVEIGMRVVSSPTPAPNYFPTNTGLTQIDWIAIAANPALADAVIGDTATARAPWIEFSESWVLQAAPAAPANDACADGIVIPSLPYVSDFIDTTGSTDTDRAVWWTWTPSVSGVVFFDARGSNYQADVDVFTGACGALSIVTPIQSSTAFGAHRSLAFVAINAVAGTTYHIRLRQESISSSSNAPNNGGVARLNAFYRQAPVVDDLYLPAGSIVQLRDGVVVNLTNDFRSSVPTGVALDYTRRPMADFNGGTHTGERILVGMHQTETVEILDLPTFNLGDFQIDFINDPWSTPTVNIHTAQLYVTAAGLLHAAWFGNGYLYIVGSGTLPSILNTVSNNSAYSALKTIDAVNGDSQAGAPFSDTVRVLGVEIAAPWAITVDEVANHLYYTSGGFYEPVGGQTIKRYDLTNNVQMPDFATVPLQGTNNPGLKGLRFLPGGGILVCNGSVVHRLDTTGAITQTYTPSVPLDSQSLCDVQLTADGTAFWVVDEPSTRVFKFNITSGVELLTTQPYLLPGTLVQMAIYQPNGAQPPPGPEEGVEACPIPTIAAVTGQNACAAPNAAVV